MAHAAASANVSSLPRTPFAQPGQKFGQSRISHRNRNVAPQSGELRPLHRRAEESSAQTPLHPDPPTIPAPDSPALRESASCGSSLDRRLPVPRANILADIAAKNLPPYLRPQLNRNLTPLFNGQIGDAKARIHLIRSGQRSRRTCLDAAPAASAPVRRNFSDSRRSLQSKSR